MHAFSLFTFFDYAVKKFYLRFKEFYIKIEVTAYNEFEENFFFDESENIKFEQQTNDKKVPIS